MKALLLFVAGLLVGANVVYFLLVRPVVPTAPAPTEQVPSPATAGADSTAPEPLPIGRASPADATPAAPTPAALPPAMGTVPAPGSDPAPLPPITATARPAAAVTSARQPLAPAAAVLAIPVAGVTASQLDNTFYDARGSERRHEALDIMAPRGTPVLAVRDGKVEKLFSSKPGGLTIYQFDPTGTYAYYYAHLDRYAPGLAEGRQLRRGDVIGYVGSTGNANPDAPHLHFAVFRLGPEKQWWKGAAIDPYPLLGGS